MTTFRDPNRPESASLYDAAKRNLNSVHGPWTTRPSWSGKSTNVCSNDYGYYLSNFHHASDAELAALAPDLARALVELVDALNGPLDRVDRVLESIQLPRRRFGRKL